MTAALLAGALILGIFTAEAQLFRRVQETLRLLDEASAEPACQMDDRPWYVCLPLRLDHAAPGQGRTPRAFCLILERTGLTATQVGVPPCI